ncbi:MAG: DUF1640 domain-containing protein [Gammaproteobacteria bacterium]|nr:DUF1640 domain-containing protein [Gammaproteobacteria bacterium]
MTGESFDTHEAIQTLERAGCPAEQAEAMVAVVTQATAPTAQVSKDLERIRLVVETKMATKEDVAELRAETHEGLAGLRTEMHEGLAGLRTEMHKGLAGLRTEMHEGLAGLRAEMHEGLAGLRAENKGDAAELRADWRIDLAELRTETQTGFADLSARLNRVTESMITRGELYRALWIQGGVLATLILSLAAITLGFALFVLTGS